MNALLKAAGCVLALVFAAQAFAQTPDPTKPPRSMASLMAEGYEISDIRIFPDKIWLRKPAGDAIPFICDRGRIGSPAFEAYRTKRYDDISCLPTH
jgi:hypothetical protein